MNNNWLTTLGWQLTLACCICLLGCGSPSRPIAHMWGVSAGNGNPLTILEYSTASRNGALIGTLTLPSSFNAGPFTTDSSGHLYVGGLNSANNAQILIYHSNSSGLASPSRTIDINYAYDSNTLAVGPTGVLYVGTVGGSGSAVAVYPAQASGAAVPLRTLQLANSNDVLLDLATDAVGRIYTVRWPAYVTNNVASYIDVYSPDASGSAAPVRTITFSSLVFGVAVDAAGNVFANACVDVASCTIEEFAADANGVASPVTVNFPAQATGMQFWGGRVRFDRAGDLFASLGVRDPSTGAVTFFLYGFGPTASGNAAPSVQITEKTPLAEFALD